jgi:restriction system protein
MSTERFWFVRAGEGGAYADQFVSEGMVGIGWLEVGPIDASIEDEELDRRFKSAFPTDRDGTRKSGAAQIKRFLREIKVGAPIATYASEERSYFLGTVKSDAQWRDTRYPRVRSVKWTERVLRDSLTVGTRNTLGSALTLFLVSEEASAELRLKALPIDSPATPQQAAAELDADKAAEAEVREDAIEKADRFIEDRIARLDWSQMQMLVAGILRGMGYKTRVSDAGSDRGVDIFASPDGLGLQEPRIFVEVKHRVGTSMGSQEIRAFLGGRKPGDRCLYVSTGGYSKDAKYEANRSSVPIELLTLPELRSLLVEHYEKLDAETRSLVPLRRIYWPAG